MGTILHFTNRPRTRFRQARPCSEAKGMFTIKVWGRKVPYPSPRASARPQCGKFKLTSYPLLLRPPVVDHPVALALQPGLAVVVVTALFYGLRACDMTPTLWHHTVLPAARAHDPTFNVGS